MIYTTNGVFGSATANALFFFSLLVSHGDWPVVCGFTQLDMFFGWRGLKDLELVDHSDENRF